MNINKICRKYRINNYTINEDGSIDVNGDVNLYNLGLTELPLIFNRVSGSFDCSYNRLTTLKGSPKYVGTNFNCKDNELTSLEDGPEKVEGGYYCMNNRKLKSLEGVGEFDYLFSDILIGDSNRISDYLIKIKLKRLIEL